MVESICFFWLLSVCDSFFFFFFFLLYIYIYFHWAPMLISRFIVWVFRILTFLFATLFSLIEALRIS